MVSIGLSNPTCRARRASPTTSVKVRCKALNCSSLKNFEARSRVLLEMPLMPSICRTRQKSANRSLLPRARDKCRNEIPPSRRPSVSMRSALMAKLARCRRAFRPIGGHPSKASSMACDSTSESISSRSIRSMVARKLSSSRHRSTTVKAGRRRHWMAIFFIERAILIFANSIIEPFFGRIEQKLALSGSFYQRHPSTSSS